MKSEKINWKLLIVITALVILVLNLSHVVDFIQMCWGAISSLVFGAMLAFVINLIMRPIEEQLSYSKVKIIQKGKRGIALLLSLMIVIAILVGLVWLVVPSLIDAGEVLAKVIPKYYEQSVDFITRVFKNNPQIVATIDSFQINWKEITEKLTGFLSSGVSGVAGLYILRLYGSDLCAAGPGADQKGTRRFSGFPYHK